MLGCVAMGGWCAWPGQHVRWRRWRISSITRRPAIERNRRTQVPGKYMYSHSVSIEIAAEHWYPWVTSFGLFRTVRILWAFFEGYGGGGFVPPEASHCFPGSLTAQSVGIMKPIHHYTTVHIMYYWCFCDGWKMMKVGFWYSKDRLWHALAALEQSDSPAGAHARHPCPQHHRPEQLMVHWPRDSCHCTEIIRNLQNAYIGHILRKNLSLGCCNCLIWILSFSIPADLTVGWYSCAQNMPWDDGKHALGWWNTKEDHFAFDFWWIVTGPCWFHQWWSLDSITGSDVRLVWLCWTFLDIFGSKHDQQVISVNPIYIVHRLIPHQSSRFALGALDQPRETELKRRHKVPWSRVVWLSLLCSTRFQFLVTCNLMI